MIKHLKIKNYKCFDNIEVSNFKRVNLFTGKNNTGKSTILEALSLAVSGGNFSWIHKLLIDRGETHEYSDDPVDVKENMDVLSSFFNNRKISFDKDDCLEISSDKTKVSLRFVRYIEKSVILKDEASAGNGPGQMAGRIKRIINGDSNEDPSAYYGFEVNSNGSSELYNLNKKLVNSMRRRDSNFADFHYINSKGDDIINNAILWDKIALSSKEEHVIEALKIIEPNIQKISFVAEQNYGNNIISINGEERYPIMRLKNSNTIYPLRAMGDGINRILNAILALVNSDGGFLFIDECENGLHYSVQDKLWEVIFKTAQKLDVQVFATTHSNDSIHSFAKVLEHNKIFDGALFRLENNNESVSAYAFSKDDIMIASKQDINLR